MWMEQTRGSSVSKWTVSIYQLNTTLVCQPPQGTSQVSIGGRVVIIVGDMQRCRQV